MKFFKAIGAFFKGLFTIHNVKAIGKVAEDVAVAASDVSTGQIPAAVLVAASIPSDASNVVVRATEATPTKGLVSVPNPEKKS
jgi:hypothetical protein